MSNSNVREASAPESLGPSEYLAQRVQEQINWYDRKSQWNQKWFKRFRLVEIVAAAMIPLLTALPDVVTMKYLVGGLGVAITLITGVLALFQFQERWTEYRATSESLTRERYLFLTRSDPYDDADAFGAFVQKIETLLSKENSHWTQSATRPNRGGAREAERNLG